MKTSTLLWLAALSTSALDASYTPTLYERVSANCGACHANAHFTTAGGYHLDNGADAHAGGVVSQTRGVDPTVMTGSDPLTALIIQKPLALGDGSTTLHGGVKLPLSNPTIQALIAWVQAGAPAADMNPPAAAAPAYYNTPAGQHTILASVRAHRRGGFRDMPDSEAGGNIHRIRFDGTSNAIIEDLNLTNLPSTDDASGPTVSLDGTKVAFARKQPGQPWQIWEINIDGTNLHQITTGSGDKLQPFYLPYSADGSPARSGEGGVGFVSNKAGFRDEYEASNTLSIYVCDAAGNSMRQLDFNPSHDVHPWMHSSGVLLFTRWEHNEHQGHNFMPIFGMCASDVAIGGTNLFGAYGEHGTSAAGNSLHEPSEVYYSGATHGAMMARGSNRDDGGGSIVGFFNPTLEGDTGTAPETNIIAAGDNDSMRPLRGDEAPLLGYTFRYPRSLMNDLFVVSRATMTGVIIETNTFNMAIETTNVYGRFELYTFEVSGSPPKMTNLRPLLAISNMNVDEVVPDLVRPTPPRIGKPVDLTMATGFFTSGDVTQRQNDGQTRGYTADQVATVRFIRALQFSQGTVNTGRRTDRGIGTQIIGEVPVASDGSFFVEVPAQVPIQFQLIGKNGRQLVTHKPWVQVAPGETMRCVGCHANHSAPPQVQTLIARESAAQQLDARLVKQFQFNKDIQPILNAKCVMCHDSAKVNGAAGRDHPLSLSGRFTPANRTEAFESLVGIGREGAYVHSQDSRNSPLIWWLTGKTGDGTAYPTPADKVAHTAMVTADELKMLQDWINTGVNFRVVDDHIPNKLSAEDVTRFHNDVWPILEANCYVCHNATGQGSGAMNFDLEIEENESPEKADRDRIEVVSSRVNFMIPEASLILRKPSPPALSGLSHVGGQFFNGPDDPQYKAIYDWIVATNAQLNAAVPPTDMVNVANYPNPFRDKTNIVYELTGNVVAKVQIEIFSLDGKMIRELSGDASPVIGWNRVEWDGKDKNGKTVGNDVYFYLLKADFADGTKKKFKGKCVKVS
jgi:hypothetical protein